MILSPGESWRYLAVPGEALGIPGEVLAKSWEFQANAWGILAKSWKFLANAGRFSGMCIYPPPHPQGGITLFFWFHKTVAQGGISPWI